MTNGTFFTCLTYPINSGNNPIWLPPPMLFPVLFFPQKNFSYLFLCEKYPIDLPSSSNDPTFPFDLFQAMITTITTPPDNIVILGLNQSNPTQSHCAVSVPGCYQPLYHEPFLQCNASSITNGGRSLWRQYPTNLPFWATTPQFPLATFKPGLQPLPCPLTKLLS